MKCTNPVKCDGEMQPLKGNKNFIECAKCGFRTPAPKTPIAPAIAKATVASEVPTNKETN